MIHHELIPSLLCFSDAGEFCPIGGLIQFFKIGLGLGIVGQLVIVSNIEAKMFFWRWDGLGH